MINIKATGFGVAKNVAAKIETVPAAIMRDIGLDLRSDLRKRVDGGKDHNGSPFKKYSESTLADKQKHRKSGVVNLEDTGNMMRQLKVEAKPNSAKVLLVGDRREVGVHHQFGLGVPRREWFGYDNESENKARASYARYIGRQVDRA